MCVCVLFVCVLHAGGRRGYLSVVSKASVCISPDRALLLVLFFSVSPSIFGGRVEYILLAAPSFSPSFTPAPPPNLKPRGLSSFYLIYFLDYFNFFFSVSSQLMTQYHSKYPSLSLSLSLSVLHKKERQRRYC